ncbi:M42 family metallopeptidase [Niallia sp. 01092]|uniref:M42 family metallopeptidase n=1 Tax=unclassified Niallia TaxID=2837522 RepID=UPI003FD1E36D
MKENIKKYFKELSGMVGVSGFEQEVVSYLKEYLSLVADEVNVDNNGNIIAVKHGKASGPKLMFSAHSDEIGFCVKNISDDGFISFDKIGGASDQLLLGRKVWITSRKIPGIIGIKAGHLQTPEESRKVKTVRECYIDLGLTSKEKVESIGIEIGDPIVFQSDFTEMCDPDLISTKSVDNRIHCAILIELLHQLKDKDFAGTLYIAINVQEEVSLRGISAVVDKIKPDYAIVLDTIPSGDTPDIDTKNVLPVYLGNGPVCPISYGSRERSLHSVIHPKVKELIKEQSEKVNVPIQYITLVGENYLTDAANPSFISNGVAVATLATPRRYSHSPVELVNLNDAEGLLKIIKSIVMDNGNKDLSFI